MLEKLLAAIERLTAALEAAAANPTTTKATTGGKKTAEKAADQSVGAPAQGTATQNTPAVTPQPASNAATAGQSAGVALDPDSVGKLMVSTANNVSRDVAVEILKKYGATGFGAVKPSDYPSFAADCKAALAVAEKSGLPAAKARSAEQQANLDIAALAAAGIGAAPVNAAAGLM